MKLKSKTKEEFPELFDLMYCNPRAIIRHENNKFFKKTKPQMIFKRKKRG